jgi:hypothetical protein
MGRSIVTRPRMHRAVRRLRGRAGWRCQHGRAIEPSCLVGMAVAVRCDAPSELRGTHPQPSPRPYRVPSRDLSAAERNWQDGSAAWDWLCVTMALAIVAGVLLGIAGVVRWVWEVLT